MTIRRERDYSKRKGEREGGREKEREKERERESERERERERSRGQAMPRLQFCYVAAETEAILYCTIL